MDIGERLLNIVSYNVSKNKKKKCHSNRKLQRFRRQCYKKGMPVEEIERLISMKNTELPTRQDVQGIFDEQMDVSSQVNTTNSPVGMPTLSENQNCVNQSREDGIENVKVDSTIESDKVLQDEEMEALLSPPIAIRSKRKRCYNISSDHWTQIIKLIPNYTKISLYQFKQVLTNVIPSYYQNFMEQWLTNLTILEVLQQRAQLMSTVFQLRIEQDYWNYISNLIDMPIVIWLSQVGKDFSKQNSINWDHTKTKSNIQHRQQIIHEKLQQTEHNLIFHLQQPYLHYGDVQDQFSMTHFIDIITHTLRNLVDSNLYYFRTNFQQKTILLHFDIIDAQLTKSFYDSNPTEEQVTTAQNIWRVKRKSCQKELHQKKKDNHLSFMVHNIKLEPVDDDQDNQLASMESYTSSMYMIVDARLRNIQGRAQEMMKFVCNIDDNVLF